MHRILLWHTTNTLMKTIIPETPPNFVKARTLERPDGFYWQNLETDEVYGPFATLAEAVNDMGYNAEAQTDMVEALRQAEEEIGIADWIDPETGVPAEEQVPHIDDEEH